MFKQFRDLVNQQLQRMEKMGPLYRVAIEPDLLWETYLNSFPAGANPIFRERTEHDCQCCRQFIKKLGGVVAIDENYELVTIWDAFAPEPYGLVSSILGELVRAAAIENVFLNDGPTVGTKQNLQLLKSGETLTFSHFYFNLHTRHVASKHLLGAKLADFKATHDVFLRGLAEISIATIDTVLELIEANTLYRGAEFKAQLIKFRQLRNEIDLLDPASKDNFVWRQVMANLDVVRLRNSVIGTLLVDLAEGMELEKAVRAFETKVAPANYKRPTALVTPKMIANAQGVIEDLGLASALARRFAAPVDVTINNLLYVNRIVDGWIDDITGAFEELKDETQVDPNRLVPSATLSMNRFVAEVLPQAQRLEVLMENRFEPNLVSLVAPVNADAAPLFKWNNGFSWAYNGNLTDSIKQRVKGAGGNVDGVLRCSLAWFNYDDLDLHMLEPNGNRIFFQNKRIKHPSSGMLDVDMNVSATTRAAVENIVYTDERKMPEGIYQLLVHCYNARETKDVGFEVELEHQGQVHLFTYIKRVRQDEKVLVAKFKFNRKTGLEFIETLPRSSATKTLWGLQTNHFVPVTSIMLSPNHWDGQAIGNKHWFFILEGCRTEQPARGFFNEFLRNDLTEHRKVLELLADKMKAPVTAEPQLAGLGFSSTQSNHLIVKADNRLYKVNF